MTRGEINSRGIVVDYACGREEYPAGVIAPREVADYSDNMSRNCEFKQHEVDAITHWQGLPDTHGDGSLYKLSEYPDTFYYKEQREDQMNRLLFLDSLLREYPERRIEGFDYGGILEARERKERTKIEKEEEREGGIDSVQIATKVSSSCDTLTVK